MQPGAGGRSVTSENENKDLAQDLKDIRKNRKRWLYLLVALAPLLIFAFVIQTQSENADSNPEARSYLKAVAACEDMESEELRLRCVKMMEEIEDTKAGGASDPCANLESADLAARCRREKIRHLAAQDPDAALSMCIGDDGYDLSCVYDVGGVAALSTLSRADEMCGKLGEQKARAACYKGIATHLGVVDPGAVKALCDLLKIPQVRSACFAGLGKAMAEDKGSAAAKAWCNKLEDADKKACLQSVIQ